ncbi:unnamed protein product [Cyprideis torosa]|uniref:Uncharacterized protein n=1 Tax=Cyprideis torosa TaxID=163714 RepID=A0A7R8WDB2_9CRUS|nr:unnamed protein product [Cyprideis torosa]CAG0894408.1 unnamed protein product [Cyprideis torosa]
MRLPAITELRSRLVSDKSGDPGSVHVARSIALFSRCGIVKKQLHRQFPGLSRAGSTAQDHDSTQVTVTFVPSQPESRPPPIDPQWNEVGHDDAAPRRQKVPDAAEQMKALELAFHRAFTLPHHHSLDAPHRRRRRDAPQGGGELPKVPEDQSFQRVWLNRFQSILSHFFDVGYHLRDTLGYMDSLWGLRRLKRRLSQIQGANGQEFNQLQPQDKMSTLAEEFSSALRRGRQLGQLFGNRGSSNHELYDKLVGDPPECVVDCGSVDNLLENTVNAAAETHQIHRGRRWINSMIRSMTPELYKALRDLRLIPPDPRYEN